MEAPYILHFQVNFQSGMRLVTCYAAGYLRSLLKEGLHKFVQLT